MNIFHGLTYLRAFLVLQMRLSQPNVPFLKLEVLEIVMGQSPLPFEQVSLLVYMLNCSPMCTMIGVVWLHQVMDSFNCDTNKYTS